MIKIVMYLSEVVRHSRRVELPKGIRQIADVSTRENKQHQITGLLTYKSGFYLQVIEGPEHAVNQLFANICEDQRHTNIQPLLVTTAKARFFSTWRMRLMNGIRTDQQFARFVAHFKEPLLALPEHQQDGLERFSFLNNGAGSRGRYAGLELWMINRPDTDNLVDSAAAFALYDKLLASRVSYEVLSSDHGFASEADLRIALDRLMKAKVLRIEKPVPPRPHRLIGLKNQLGRELKQRMRDALSFS
ncbi:MAG: BLUF domain-containing protein [Pseudomonadota bacterium]